MRGIVLADKFVLSNDLFTRMRAMTMAMAMAMAMAIASASLMEKFFFNAAKLFRLGGVLAFWPPFGILAHASKSAGIVALFSIFYILCVLGRDVLQFGRRTEYEVGGTYERRR